jgi:cell division protein FtsN
MDYAKRASKSVTRIKSRIPGWVWFFTGLVTGCFISFLVYLGDYLPKTDDQTVEKRPTPRIVRPDELVKELQLDFYEIFPNSEVPVVEEYTGENSKITPEKDYVYILQVGSFRRATDADSLRARLLLLGMDAYTKPGEVRGEFWHRVLVGPLTTRLELNRTQDKLAEEGIEAIPLKLEAN